MVAPFRRLGNAQQSALMLREGPRRSAVASETGEWSHVDVYLTKTQDYRMLLMPGSRYESELLRWTRERGTTVVSVGDDVEQRLAVDPLPARRRRRRPVPVRAAGGRAGRGARSGATRLAERLGVMGWAAATS